MVQHSQRQRGGGGEARRRRALHAQVAQQREGAVEQARIVMADDDRAPICQPPDAIGTLRGRFQPQRLQRPIARQPAVMRQDQPGTGARGVAQQPANSPLEFDHGGAGGRRLVGPQRHGAQMPGGGGGAIERGGA